MAGDVVIWKPRGIGAASIERSLAIIRGAGEVPVRAERPLPVATSSRNPPRLDVLRTCAEHDRPWAAVYLLARDGSYQYSTSIQITKLLYRTQYVPGAQETQVIDSQWIDEETCPWCGVSGKGAFLCAVCKKLVGHCRSNGMYFRCRPGCTGEGWATPGNFENIALAPRILR
jgi:hypothetical protein